MGRVRLLNDQTINRIAAGEVVERPASAVKELVENSLDAGATSIRVHVVAGGKRLIRVADDGEGMDRDDVLLALERHATSKVADASDLAGIGTLGFRGEALPSIAAVSRFLIRSAARDGEGTEVEVRGGTIRAVRETGIPKGTTVEVASLFFNVPARRKFLRSDATELAHVVRLVTRHALASPSVRFHLDHAGRTLLEAPPVENAGERIAQLHGAAFAERLLPFRLEAGPLRFHGFAGRPVDAGPRRDSQHVFVNGRPVRDRVLSHAVTRAYGDAVPRDRHPPVFLFVETEAGQVDVNVHPQKTEVRFGRSSDVHDLACEAVASALSDGAAVPALHELRPAAATAPSPSVAEATLRYLETHGDNPRASDGRWKSRAAGYSASAPPGPSDALADTCRPALSDASVAPPLEGSNDRTDARQLVALMQFRDSYIVADDGEGLVLVDQHAAHERVLFERYLEEAENDAVEVQKLLFPVTLELAPDERVLLEDEADEFRRLGFLVEPFGGDTAKLDGIPAICEGHVPADLLREILGEARSARSASTSLAELRRKLVTTAACHAAIKINHSLTREEMQGLVNDLSAARNPTTCPHGRPVLFRLSLVEIERAFRRR